MALLKIARMGHPVLRTRAREVEDPTDPSVRALVRSMIETMYDAPGVGLAAPQVHVARRVIVFRVPEARQEPGEPEAPDGPLALVNPTFEPLEATLAEGLEGCLSIPEIRGLVPRYHRIAYYGTTPDGRRIEREATGFHARVVQHEIDHLDGVLFLDRMADFRSLAFESELHHLTEGGDEGETASDDDEGRADERS
ncbi:MAG: peptide deformylase [Azospirillaceae bacterium]